MPNGTGSGGATGDEARPSAAPPPVRTAACVALGFLLLSTTYIVISDAVATRLAVTPEQIENVQRSKGILFMAMMGVLIFATLKIMLERIRRAEAKIEAQHEALLRSERRGMAGILAASVAHDINNVLTSLSVDLSLISDAVRAEPGTRDVFSRVEKSYEQLSALSRRLVTAGRDSSPGEFALVELRDLLDDCVRVSRINTRSRASRFEIEGGPITLTANAAVLRQLFVNLFQNAVEASTRDLARVLVEIATVDGCVVVKIHDDGPGLRPDIQGKLFKPFTTTKADGNGLGLVSVRACAQMHGGRVEAGSSHMGGACFTVTLPLDGHRTPSPPPFDP